MARLVPEAPGDGGVPEAPGPGLHAEVGRGVVQPQGVVTGGQMVTHQVPLCAQVASRHRGVGAVGQAVKSELKRGYVKTFAFIQYS